MPLDDTSHPDRQPVSHPARWLEHEDAESLTLQIELGNDLAVTLVCWKNGDPPTVGLWRGSGSHDFTKSDLSPGETPDRFRQWIAEAAV